MGCKGSKFVKEDYLEIEYLALGDLKT